MDIRAVIPLRAASDCNDSGEARFSIGGRPLWDITIAYALQNASVTNVVVAYDDDCFLSALEQWKDRVHLWKRPAYLSAPDITTLDVLGPIAAHMEEIEGEFDYLMLLEITHPLRPPKIADQIISLVRKQSSDSVFTARSVPYNIWRSNNEGFSRIHGAARGEAIFEEMIGICSLFSPRFLNTSKPFGDMVDVVPIDRFWAAIDVRDADSQWMAEQYYKRLNVIPSGND